MTHCFCHQLALVAKHASDDVEYLSITLEPTLLKLWIYSHYSPVRKERLDFIFDTICEKQDEVAITKGAFIRWLSHKKAVLNMRSCLVAVVLEMSTSMPLTVWMDTTRLNTRAQ